jgi:type IV pilus assembly protein PilP
MFSGMRMLPCLVLVAAVALGACGGDEEFGGTQGLGGPSGESGAKKKTKPAAPAAGGPRADLGPIVYTDEDFVELDIEHRDPFRSYASAFKAQAAAPAQRRVLMPNTSLDEMRLIAIVTGITTPRAMLTDTAQVGHVVRRGDYIGRPEVVQSGGSEGMPVTLNWRVDRIRPGSVVLTREDPTSPDKPPLTRVMPLREGGEPTPLSESP